jgi:radical SAM-linked protein
MRVQRLRVQFNRGPELRFITHLDLMRSLERAIRRSGIDIAYSEGFSPHPQISLAAPLPVGVTSRGEIMDIFLASPMPAEDFALSLSTQLPKGLCLGSVEEIPVGLPSLQSQLRCAEYEIGLPVNIELSFLQGKIDNLLARESIEWIQKREKGSKSYDLRPLILSLAIEAGLEGPLLAMRLRAGNEATGRPDQVIAALDLPGDLPIERTRMILAGEMHCS